MDEGTEGGEQQSPPADPNADPNADANVDNREGKAILDGKKVSPWKIVDHYKGHMARLQKEIAEIKANPGSHPEFKSITEKAAALEARNSELEEEMRYVNYQKHPEFIEKYQKPYEEAWGKAMTGLKGLQLSITNQETGEAVGRDITPQDIATFAGLDPAAARHQIKQLLPDPVDAAEVRGYVDRIRDLAHSQQKALTDQRKVSGDRERQRAEQSQLVSQQLTQEIAQTYQQTVAEATQKYDFLRPVEGDEKYNSALESAAKFVDESLRLNPANPKLTKEQRQEIVKKHVALRNRAIAYSTLKYKNAQMQSQLAQLQEQLKGFQSSEPGSGNGSRATVPVTPGDPMSASLAALRGMASK